MEDKILDGKKLADKLNFELKEKLSNLIKKTGIKPKLVTIIVGENPASKVYVNIKHKTCEKVGIDSLIIELDENVSQDQLIDEILKHNEEPSVHGILLQLPVPDKLRNSTSRILEYIDPQKDVDGLNPLTKGKLFNYDEELAPCTAKGIIKLLEYNKINLKGKDIVIINRSNLVGKPLIFMLLKRNATVSICHTSTINIDSYIQKADILIVAVGKPGFITAEKIKNGVVIIDVGITRIEGKLYGDVDYNGVLYKCGKITPVPGGIGPMTVAMLCANTITAYKNQLYVL